MRTWCAIFVLVNSAAAQFFSFNEPRQSTSQIEALGDQFGVREALGAWSKVLRNMATRPQINRRVTPPNVRDFTIPPNVKKEDIEKITFDKKEGDNIINERLLYLLLPRIKGQPAFTTTTLPTTTVKTTKKPPTTTAELEKEYLEKLALLKAQKTVATTRVALETFLATSTIPTTASPGKGETTTIPSTKGSPHFTVVFHTAAKEKFEEKTKMESKVLSILSSAIKEHEEKFRKASKESYSTHEKGIDQNQVLESTHAPLTSRKASDEWPTEQNSVEQVAEVALRRALKVDEPDDDASFVRSMELPTSTAYSEATTPMTTTTEESLSSSSVSETTIKNVVKSTESTTTSIPSTTSIVTAEEASEVNEVLSLIEEDEKAEKAEGTVSSKEIKLLREKTRAKILAFLQKRVDKITAELDRTTSTTVTTTTTKMTTTPTNTTNAAPTTTSTTPEALKTTPSTTATTSTVTSTATTTSIATTTTVREKENEDDSVAFKQIPEAEEDDGDVPPPSDSGMEVTTTTRIPTLMSDALQPSHMHADAAKLAHVITPIAGIIDNIGPIIAPLLQSQVAASAASAKVAGVRTYERPGRDLLAHSDGENSIIGYGTQLAREILNPGSLQRDREDQQKALAAKIAQVKESLKYNSNSVSDVRTIPIYQALAPPPLPVPTSPNRINYAHAYPRVASVPLSEQAAHAAINTVPQQTLASTLPPYFVAPPPGYVGPLPPPPPPPPPSAALTSQRLPQYTMETLRRAPQQPVPSKPVDIVLQDEATSAGDSHSFEKNELPTFTIEELPASASKETPSKEQKTPNGLDQTGYESGRSGVKATFFEDSGVMMGVSEEANSGAGPPFGGGGGSGFGGGRRPTESFEEAASASRENVSFFGVNRKKMAKN
ncbi:hypothetical protein Q1695_000455 [Nippostrongylus brasiliensis]|nr:hypothetical protein Q1695_000455 [Nippostrongylus brasiliensis]